MKANHSTLVRVAKARVIRVRASILSLRNLEGALALAATTTLILLTVLIPRDSWDGVIFAYASDIQDYRGWLRFLDESGWEITAPIMLAAETAGALLGTSYFFVLKLFLVAGIIGLARESYLYVRTILRFSTSEAYLVVALLLSSSVWVSLSGSPIIWHFLSIPLTLLAWRKSITSETLTARMFGLLLVVVCSSVATNALVIAVLSIINLASDTRPKGARSPWVWSLIAAVIALVTQSSIRILNPTHGRYESYNSILLSFSEPPSNSVISALFWFALTFAIVFVPLAGVIVLSKKSKFLRSTRHPAATKVGRLSLFSVLFGTALIPIPYVLIGKGPAFLDPWEGRHAFYFAIFLSISLMTVAIVMGVGRKTVVAAVIPIMCFGLLAQLVGHAMRLDRYAYEEEVSGIFSQYLSAGNGGYVYVDVHNGPWPELEPRYHYETQYLLFKATRSSGWLSTGSAEAHLNQRDGLGDDAVDNLRDLYSPSSLDCLEKFELRGVGFGWSWNLLSRMVGFDDSKIFVLEHSQRCVTIGEATN